MGFDLPSYLDRIGHTATVQPDLACLTALHSEHVAAIPFEGIDPLLGRPVRLDLPSLSEKLVKDRRGGYCFEQNSLFRAALEEIGFKVTGLAARVRWMSPPESPLGPREHMLLHVDIEGESYIADVGFGACLMDSPLRLEKGVEQRTGMGTFRLVESQGLYALEALQPGGWRVMYMFDLVPQLPSDFDMGNWYASTSSSAPFVHVLIMERLDRDRRHKMINKLYRIEARDGAVLSEDELKTPAALADVLDEVFRTTPPIDVDDLFFKISQASLQV